jgi:hypothetical protein
MPEFLVSEKYKEIFNDYDLSVIKTAHSVPREDPSIHRQRFIERLKSRYPNPRRLPPSTLETIQKIERLSEGEFYELMKMFRYA